MDALQSLVSDEFLISFSFISTPAALHRVLRRSAYVTRIEEGLQSGSITEQTIKKFATHLLQSLKAGELFQFDLTLAALATALEQRSTEFAEEYLHDLSKLKLAEMPMSIRVARECLKSRLSLAKTKIIVPEPAQVEVDELPADDPPTLISYDELASLYPRDVNSHLYKTVCEA